MQCITVPCWKEVLASASVAQWSRSQFLARRDTRLECRRLSTRRETRPRGTWALPWIRAHDYTHSSQSALGVTITVQPLLCDINLFTVFELPSTYIFEETTYLLTSNSTYSYIMSQKIPPGVICFFFSFFRKQLRIFNRFLHTYYTFLCTLDYKFLFSYLQLWRSYAILRATT